MSTQLVSVFSSDCTETSPSPAALEQDPFGTLRNEGALRFATAADEDRERIGEADSDRSTPTLSFQEASGIEDGGG